MKRTGTIATGLLIGLVLLAGIMVVRALTYGAAPGKNLIVLPEPPIIDSERAAENLGSAIRFRTVTTLAGDPKPGQAQPWLDFQAFLQNTYAEVIGQMDRELIAGLSLLYTWQGSDPSLDPIILMAHQDVVPINPATVNDWTHGAFAGAVADGYVWGRGAMDDKASLIMLLEAAQALANEGWKPTRTIMFLFGHDEEVSGSGAKAAFALLQARGIHPALVLDEGSALLAKHPLTGKTAAAIGIAEKGYLSLQISVQTQGGHSSRPPRESGAVRIARAITALEDNQLPADLYAPPFLESVRLLGNDLDFISRLAFANTWLLGSAIKAIAVQNPVANATLRTTTAPTMMAGSIKDNVLPQRAFAVVNFRVHPSNTGNEVIDHVRKVTGHIEGLVIEPYIGSISSEPSPVSSTTSRPYKVLEAIASSTGGGVPVTPTLVIGGTDSRYAAAITDDNIYRFAPAIYASEDLQGFHGTNERVSVDNLRRMGEGYARIMMVMGSE